MGPDDGWEDRDDAGGTGEDDAEVANLSDTGVSDTDLPAYEDDTGDTGDTEQNP
jgi:hypothetical protein